MWIHEKGQTKSSTRHLTINPLGEKQSLPDSINVNQINSVDQSLKQFNMLIITIDLTACKKGMLPISKAIHPCICHC